MLGVLVNVAAVIVGGLAGLLFQKGIPEKLSKAIMLGIGLCVLYIGFSGTLESRNTLALIFSIVFGAIVGTLLDIDAAFTRLGQKVETRLQHGDRHTPLAEGFVTASLLFCVGAMAVVGSLNAGLKGENEMLFTKSLLDGISACMLTVSLGAGVLLSSAAILLYQGAIALLAGLIAPVLNAAAIAEMTGVGSLLILALGLNMIGLTKIKVANYLPAILFAPLFTWLLGLIPGL